MNILTVTSIGALFTIAALSVTSLFGAVGPSFHPDVTLQGSNLAGWHSMGEADWRLEHGELVGKPRSASGGWLVMDRAYQDVGLFVDYKCMGACVTGVLFRAQKTASGMDGTYVELSDPAVPTETVTVAADGRISSREKTQAGGGLMRFTPPVDPNRPSRPPFQPPTPPADLPLTLPDASVKLSEWNTAEMFMDANVLRTVVNDGREHGAVSKGNYGSVAFFVGGTGEVHFRNVGYRDLSAKVHQAEETSPNFRKQVLSEFFYSFTAASADFNRDGVADIVSGPLIYFGPDYTKSREIYPAEAFNETSGFSGDAWIQSADDFTGDGWPDVIATNYGPTGITLYVNPGKEDRRWDKYKVVDEVQSEVAVFRDVDGDGKAEIVYMGGGQVRYAKPDPANPTGKWIVKNVSEKGYGAAHGMGVGDINGDGRMDIVTALGWWEGPATPSAATWTYHPQAFGRYGHGIVGGATMGVYDVNGDGKADVVTALNAHGWGLAWYEQKRDGDKITFVQHMIADDLNTTKENAGGVAFSEPHGSAFADMNGDNIPDFIVGKRYLSHLNTYLDPDPFGQPVLYVYKVVRDAKAPGGARFAPELVDNKSGAGSDLLVMDFNHDGAMDIVTATRFGTMIFWGKPQAKHH